MLKSSIHSFSFGRKERLKNARAISLLFENGKSLYLAPVRVIWQMIPSAGDAPVMVAFSVSSRNFKRAVDRNLLKRRMREAYRKNKHLLYGSVKKDDHTLHLFFIYTSNQILSYAEVENSVIRILGKLKVLTNVDSSG